MEFVYALPEACNVAWAGGGVWLNKGDAYPADDPFVLAHPELFSKVPPNFRSTQGRPAPYPTPLSELTPDLPKPARRG